MAYHSEVEILIDGIGLLDVIFVSSSILKVKNDMTEILESIDHAVVRG